MNITILRSVLKNHALFIILAVLGVVAAIFLSEKVLPSANLDLKILPKEAEQRAEAYLKEKGFDTASYQRATDFFDSKHEVVFLQKSWGIEKLHEEIKKDSTLGLWGYQTRFFKPLEKEEFVVFMDVAGEHITFTHVLPESREGAKLTKEEAGIIAQKYLEEKENINLSDYEEKDYNISALDKRTDHVFSYKLKGWDIDWNGDMSEKGKKLIMVRVAGDEVAMFKRGIFYSGRIHKIAGNN